MRTAIYLPNFLWRTLKVVVIDLAHARCLRPLSYYVRLLERMGVVGVIWISDVDHELTLGPSDNLDLNALVQDGTKGGEDAAGAGAGPGGRPQPSKLPGTFSLLFRNFISVHMILCPVRIPSFNIKRAVGLQMQQLIEEARYKADLMLLDSQVRTHAVKVLVFLCLMMRSNLFFGCAAVTFC